MLKRMQNSNIKHLKGALWKKKWISSNQQSSRCAPSNLPLKAGAPVVLSSHEKNKTAHICIIHAEQCERCNPPTSSQRTWAAYLLRQRGCNSGSENILEKGRIQTCECEVYGAYVESNKESWKLNPAKPNLGQKILLQAELTCHFESNLFNPLPPSSSFFPFLSAFVISNSPISAILLTNMASLFNYIISHFCSMSLN